LQQNVERYLHDHNFPSSTIRKYIHDIFGWNDDEGLYHEGLVDNFDSKNFHLQLTSLKSSWDQLEKHSFPSKNTTSFHDWFTRIKAPEFIESTLRSLREDAGLGSPPKPFYTNHSESINAFLKESLSYKKHQWGVFNEKIKSIVLQQQKDGKGNNWLW
jgi:hypothetical protein